MPMGGSAVIHWEREDAREQHFVLCIGRDDMTRIDTGPGLFFGGVGVIR